MKKVKSTFLDALFSEYIRRRAIAESGGCQKCLTPKFDIQKDNGEIYPAWKQLQNSHYIGRSNKQTRWDPDDCIGACGACHMYLDSHPREHLEFMKQKLGQRGLDLLDSRARETWPKPDEVLLTLWLKQEIAKLEKEGS